MDYIALTKKVISTVVGIGTAKIVSGIIESNVATETVPQKVSVAAASYAIGYAASEASSSYTDAKIDEIVQWWYENVTARSKND